MRRAFCESFWTWPGGKRISESVACKSLALDLTPSWGVITQGFVIFRRWVHCSKINCVKHRWKNWFSSQCQFSMISFVVSFSVIIGSFNSLFLTHFCYFCCSQFSCLHVFLCFIKNSVQVINKFFSKGLQITSQCWELWRATDQLKRIFFFLRKCKIFSFFILKIICYSVSSCHI